MKVPKISLKDPNAAEAFVEALKNTGFAVVTDHGIDPVLLDSVYSDWAMFFKSDDKFLYDHGTTQSGYFPFKSENAKDSKIKDLKEFYHLYPAETLPNGVSDLTWRLHGRLQMLAMRLLNFIQTQLPQDVVLGFSQSLIDMVAGSERSLFRVLHYPPVPWIAEPGAVRASAHEDINLITILVAGTAPGLEVKDLSGNWHSVECDPGELVVNVGDMLQLATGNYLPSTSHRVVNPKQLSNNLSRYSIPFFVHPRADVLLADNFTAEDFLQQRLKEILG